MRRTLILLLTAPAVAEWVNPVVTTLELPWFHPPIDWVAANKVSADFLSLSVRRLCVLYHACLPCKGRIHGGSPVAGRRFRVSGVVSPKHWAEA